MKHRLRALTLAALCCATSLQIMAEKTALKFINDIGIATPVTIDIKQGNGKEQKDTFRRNTNKLYYDSEQDKEEVNIGATIKIGKDFYHNNDFIKPEVLKNTKEIRIKKNDNNVPLLVLVPKNGPRKQQIRAYKPNKSDQKEDWTVKILDNKGGIIATSTFKENTDYRAKKLYLQLNQPAVGADDANEKYNDNTIQVFSKKLLLPMLKINAASFKTDRFAPGSEIEITKDLIDIVDKSGKSVLTDAAKAESREFIEFELEEVLP